MINPRIARLRFRSKDYDEFGTMLEVAHVEEKLLESGEFNGKANIVMTPKVMVCNFDISRKVLQLGTGTPGYITFGIWEPTVQFSWRRIEMNKCMIGVLWKKEHRSVTGGGFGAFPISIEENFFMEKCRTIGRADLIDKLLTSEVLELPEDKLVNLRRLLMFAVSSDELNDQTATHLLEVEAVDLLIDLLLEMMPEPPNLHHASYRFEKVVDHIHDNLSEITSVNQISANTNIPERTIRRLIQKRYDISPKTYLNRLRLNEVRKELKKEKNGASIIQVASRYNFWHMGQFTKDYKLLFGELPSETLGTAKVIH